MPFRWRWQQGYGEKDAEKAEMKQESTASSSKTKKKQKLTHLPPTFEQPIVAAAASLPTSSKRNAAKEAIKKMSGQH